MSEEEGGSKLSVRAALGGVFRYSLTCLSAGAAETITFPIDITKTRLQVQGQLQPPGAASTPANRPRQSATFRHTFAGIVREEGVLALYRGLPAAILRHVVYTGARLGIYERMRQLMMNATPTEPTGGLPLWKSAICSAVGGGCGQFIASPTDLVKVQMQVQGARLRSGNTGAGPARPLLYRSTADCARQLLRQNGFLGMWRGWVPNTQRAALVNLGELTTYDYAKHQLLRHTELGDTFATHMASGIMAGFMATLVGTPADVVKSRIMAQQVASGPTTGSLVYKGSVDCLVQTVTREGVLALWKGFLPNWIRLGPWSLTFWVTYEQLRRLAGLSSF